MVKWVWLAAAALLAAACSRQPEPAPADPTVRLEQVWRLSGLANPESVVLSGDGGFLYVSNVSGEGEAKDGEGFIARVGVDGRMIEREWARGLDAPKGLALVGDELYVADIDQVVVLNAESGAVVRRVPAPGARFLNDAAATRDGVVLVADSQGARIYSVQGGTAQVWLEHPLLESVNGLLPEPERLVATTMAGRLLEVDYESRAVHVLAEGLGDADGIAPLDGERYLVSEWLGLMHVVAADGTHETIMDTRGEDRFLNDFLLVGDTLYQPHWEPSELTAYRVVQGAP